MSAAAGAGAGAGADSKVPALSSEQKQFDDNDRLVRSGNAHGRTWTDKCTTTDSCLAALYIIGLIAMALCLAKTSPETLTVGAKVGIGIGVGIAPALLYALHRYTQGGKPNRPTESL